MYMYLDWTAREAKLRDAIICLLTFIGHMVHDHLLRTKAKAPGMSLLYLTETADHLIPENPPVSLDLAS